MSYLRSKFTTLAASAALLTGLMAAGSAQAEPTWNLDTSHSRVAFSVRHLGISNVTGEFSGVTGSGQFDGKNLDKAKVDATIDVNTINTRDAKRDAHLKAADFFDAAKYPTMSFHSKRFRAMAGGKFSLTGDLTMHGVTKTVVLDGVSTAAVKDPWGNTRVGATATTRVNRQDFGLTWSKALETGALVVGNDVDITLDLEFVQAK